MILLLATRSETRKILAYSSSLTILLEDLSKSKAKMGGKRRRLPMALTVCINVFFKHIVYKFRD